MCDHHLSDGPLVCDRTTDHDAPKGCTYTGSAGPDLDNASATTPKRHATGDEQ